MLEALRPTAKLVANAVLSVMSPQARRRFKEYHELRFWRSVIVPIVNDPAKMAHERSHYQFFFTEFFGLAKSDYLGKAALDIGCGPMGSLEWADNARERVGADPLASQYLRLVEGVHVMTYCAAPSEDIPFPDGHFDRISLFNCLDHVDDVEATIREVKRLASAEATVLLIVEIGHAPTPTEPHNLDETVVERFGPEFVAHDVRLFGVRDDHNLYASLKHAVPYTKGEPGVLAARLERKLPQPATAPLGAAKKKVGTQSRRAAKKNNITGETVRQ